MSKLVWDQTGERLYETGVDHGVIYPMSNGEYPLGVAWNGLTSVDENPSGADSNAVYADNIKYLNLISKEDWGATIGAYTYPDEFAECDGSAEIAPGVRAGQQTRKTFGFSYRSKIGNDEVGEDYGYKLHLVYGAKASPSGKSRSTINESPEAMELSWEIATTPVEITTKNPKTNQPYKPMAHLEIDSTKTTADKMEAIEDIIYGTSNSDARLPLPDEVIRIMTATEPEPTPTYTYTEVTPVGTENPSTEGWYELVDETYVLSEDTEVNNEKTYYERVSA